MANTSPGLRANHINWTGQRSLGPRLASGLSVRAAAATSEILSGVAKFNQFKRSSLRLILINCHRS